MPYDTYRLHQIERAKCPAEVRRADQQAAGLAGAVSSLLRGITRRGLNASHSRPQRPASLGRPDQLAWAGCARERH